MSDFFRTRGRAVAFLVVLALALALRLRGIHDPILDHPGWRQGDTAAIARNFATLDPNPLHPQTDYDGPPPNYVELEFQIVPWLASLVYRVVGVHEIVGRLISLSFGVATVAVVWRFAARLFGARAALPAALVAAILPGAVYYSRTFMPDTTMVFFATFALERWYAYFDDDSTAGAPRAFAERARRLALPAVLTAIAFLAKPVALTILVPLLALWVQRRGVRGTLLRPELYAALVVAFVPLVLYDRAVAAIAEWHWASGITRLHVVPDLVRALREPPALATKLGRLVRLVGMLRATMVGLPLLVLVAIAIVVPAPVRARGLLFGWLAGAVLYAFVVVTVERVDYYLYLVLPLVALWCGGLLARVADLVPARPLVRSTAATVAALATLFVLRENLRAIAPYYRFDHAVYARAVQLRATLAPGTLVVMGHYDPSILYTIGHKGWEEDAYLWTPFDEQSAIRKGARYFIAVEPNRLARNVELSAWLARFPLLRDGAAWPVYVTDYARVLPGAESRWRRFRDLERAGKLPRSNVVVPPSAGVLAP